MTALAHRVILAWGWTRALIAVLSGAVAALSMPPFGLLPALVAGLVPAIWLLDGASAGGRLRTLGVAALIGWCWGFGYFVAGLWWLGAAFLVEADQFAWALPLGVLGLPAGLALFPALGFALARALWSPGPARLLAFAAALGFAEWLRGHVLTGFPWNSPGLALAQTLPLMQAGSVLGLDGLNLVAILIGVAPATLGTARTGPGRAGPALAALALVAGLAVFGALRIPAQPMPTVAGVKLRVLQPNLPQDAKFNPENRDAIMRRYLDLSDRATGPQTAGIADATHLVWPESAFPFLLHRDARALNQIADFLPPGVTLITGAARADEPLPGEVGARFFNAIQVVGHDGAIAATYDKVHLVPFGEYLPRFLDGAMRSLGIRQFVRVPGGFEPGERKTGLAVAGLPPVAATICYEAIFPGEILPEGPRPGLILNVTNDAWFGRTPGPHQHFAQARLRAVEQGLPLVRSANTGISAVVDPFGRIVAGLPLGAEGVVDAPLPQAAGATLYGRFGNVLFLILSLAFVGLALRARRT